MKSAMLYLALVGIPVVLVALVLDQGRSLVPPAWVGGEWHLVMRSDSSCPAPPGDSLMLKISQSGPHLVVTLGDSTGARLVGRLDQWGLNASDPGGATLRATIDSGSGELQGSLSGFPCAGARLTAIHGLRPSSNRPGVD